MSAPRQINLDGSLVPLEHSHRISAKRTETHLLRNGRIGTLERCRCGYYRVVTRRTDGQREATDWAASHPEAPPLLSTSTKR